MHMTQIYDLLVIDNTYVELVDALCVALQLVHLPAHTHHPLGGYLKSIEPWTI